MTALIAFVPGIGDEFLLVRGETLGQRSTRRTRRRSRDTSRTSSPPLFRGSIVVFIFRQTATSGPKAVPKVLANWSTTSRRGCAAADATGDISPHAVAASNWTPTTAYASTCMPSVPDFKQVLAMLMNGLQTATLPKTLRPIISCTLELLSAALILICNKTISACK